MRVETEARLSGSRHGRLRPPGPWGQACLCVLALGALLGIGVSAALAAAPVATIEPATEVGFSTAHASGEVDPAGNEEGYFYFQHATQSQFENDEWQGEDGREGFLQTSPFPVSAQITGLSPGTLYHLRLLVASAGETVVAEAPTFETKAANAPLVSLEEPSAITTSGAHFEGTVNSNGTGEGESELHYHFQCSPECPGIEAEAEAPADGSDHAVEADATGLEPHTEYTVALIATNLAGARGEASRSFTTGVVAPVAYAGPNTPEGSHSVRITAYLDPNNSEVTDCYFLYGPTTAYGSSAPCEGPPATGGQPVQVSARVGGLPPQLHGHYKLLAATTVGPTESEDAPFVTYPKPEQQSNCPNESIRQQQGSTSLPLCMAYELVSPADTAGADIDSSAGSADGNNAWIQSTVPISREGRTGNFSTMAAHRSSNGWKQTELADPAVPSNDSFFLAARASDSSSALVGQCPQFLISCSGYLRYVRVATDGSRTLMFEQTPFTLGESVPPVVATSDDLSTIAIQAGRMLPEDTHLMGSGLYVSRDGHLEFAGYDQNGNVLECGAALANGNFGTGFEQNGMSADGSTIAYESPDPGAGCPGPVDVYVRRGGHSIDISAPRNGNPDQGATYLGSSRDGNTVYFMTTSRLASGDTDSFSDIYRYDLPSETLTRITPGSDVMQASVSPQGDYVYFEAENPIAGEGTAGQLNLFVYHAGAIKYVMTAISEFHEAFGLGRQSSPLTPDGKHLLFVTAAELTGQPIHNQRFQVMRYDVSDNTIVCVSCPTDGSPPTFGAALGAASPAGNQDVRFQSDNGETMVFATRNALVPQDINNRVDSYLWHDGAIALISSGRAEYPARTISIDSAGHNVFFMTTDRLALEAEQDNIKLYDARVDGGFLAAPPAPKCAGDACRSAAGVPAPPAAASAALHGAGNVRQHRRHRRRKRHPHHHSPAAHRNARGDK